METIKTVLNSGGRNILYKFTCYNNGLGPCPRRFTIINKAPSSEPRLKRRHISGYIDDFYVQGQTYNELCQLGTIEAVKLFDELGYVIHPITISLIPSQQIEHLGYVINSVKIRVTLTENKT